MSYVIADFVKGAGDDCHYQLLESIKTMAELEGWVTQRYDTSTDNHEWIAKGVGYSATEEIYIGIKTYQDATSDYYNFDCAIFDGFISTDSFESQPGYKSSGVPLYRDNLTAYLVATPQKISFVVKVVASIFVHAYMGKFFPYANSNEYPYPICVGGMFYAGAETRRYSDTNMNFPYKGNGNTTTASQESSIFVRDIDGYVTHKFCYPYTFGTNKSNVLFGDATGMTSMALIPVAGVYPIEPIIMHDSDIANAPAAINGELEGIYAVSGLSNSSENVMQIGGTSTIDQTGLTPSQAVAAILNVSGRAFIIAQNANKTNPSDFIAMELK